MRTLSGALDTHINSVPTTLAAMIKITPVLGSVIAMTDHQGSLVFDAVTYVRRGFNFSSLMLSVDLSVGSFDLDVLYVPAVFTLADVKAGKYAGAKVELFFVNYADLTQGKLPVFEGLVGAVVPAELGARLEVNSRKKLLESPIVERYTPDCRAILGDARCTKNLTAFTHAGVIETVTSREVFKVTSGFGGPASPADYFSYGVITFTSGANNGISREIKNYVSGTRIFTMRRAFPYDIAASDTLSAVAGCDKKFSTCKVKFDNIPFFRGEPHIPTKRQLSAFIRRWFQGHAGGNRFDNIGNFF
jgi:uncharacterized phage protein (TIGR02218 family)